MSNFEPSEWPDADDQPKFNWSQSMNRIMSRYGHRHTTEKRNLKMGKALIPKVPWTKEIYEEKLKQVEADIAEVNKQINKNNKRISEHLEIKKQLCNKVAKKWAYRKLLLSNIKEHFPEPDIHNTTGL